MTEIDSVVEALRAARFFYTDEDQLQQGIAGVLAAERVHAEREVRLEGAGRIDFLCAGGTGIEVKIAGSEAKLERQILRYLFHGRLTGLVIVTDRVRHQKLLLIDVDNKPVRRVSLLGQGL